MKNVVPNEKKCDEAIRRSLRYRVRATEEFFNPGSKVIYKRDGQDRWRGAAMIIGNDGSVYYLRHQGNLYRVPACRIKYFREESAQTVPTNMDVDENQTQSSVVSKPRNSRKEADESDEDCSLQAILDDRNDHRTKKCFACLEPGSKTKYFP